MDQEILPAVPTTRRSSIIWDLLLILVILGGMYFRLVGMNWDANQHLHPDERFLTMVETSISPVENLQQYFDTATSSLNPNNRGHGFFVYGTLPIFLVRYLAESLNQTGYDQVFLVGRYTSAVFDVFTILIVFLAAARLFKSDRTGLLAAAFYAVAVLPIQLSHYFTVDTFLGFFGALAFYCAVLVMTARAPETVAPSGDTPPVRRPLLDGLWQEWQSLLPYLFFGLALGMAAASKVSAAPLVILLPAAAIVFYSRLPKNEQERWIVILLRNLAVAAVVFLVTFRFFQPYAFSGPGFFGVKLNPNWLANLKELSLQSTGDVDFPPALQWARRPLSFAWTNMVKWGLGLPLGLLAWGGFLWMGWRILKGEWRRYALLWGWTLVYFAYQSINWVRTMRYQILVYPTLAMIAGWVVIALWERRDGLQKAARRVAWQRVAAVLVGGLVLIATTGWAYAFTRIYTRPMTRVAASQWIYQNVPAPINVVVESNTGATSIPVGFRYGFDLTNGEDWVVAFRPSTGADLQQVRFAHIVDQSQDPNPKTVTIAVKSDLASADTLANGTILDPFPAENDGLGKEFRVPLDTAVTLDPAQMYYLVVHAQEGTLAPLTMSGPVALDLMTVDGAVQQTLPEPVKALRDSDPTFTTSFTAPTSGQISKVTIPHIVDWSASPGVKTLVVSVARLPQAGLPSEWQGRITGGFLADADPRGSSYTFTIEPPLAVDAGEVYYVSISRESGAGSLAIYGSKTALETTWDDPLPLPMAGFSPFDYNNGLYRSDLNFEMYWDDSPDKLDRFISILNQADYVFITSNRQWGTTTRVPERYPLTSYYYRNLLGCPDSESILTCYAQAKPGMYQGKLGFTLERIFQSDPSIGPLSFNTQFAEEAFTVYDHPKVLVFKKTADYSPQRTAELLSSVDLSTVIHLTPRKAGSTSGNLMLPVETLARQRAGGTWSELFSYSALVNRYPGLGLVVWYLALSVLGWLLYPLLRLALRGLPDRGYPFSKLAGLLLLAYLSWLAGSADVPVTRWAITAVAGGLAVAGLLAAWAQRAELAEEWRERRGYFLAVELVALSFFALDLLIRIGNPDLWHPYKGGEKPMDFSYFNAIIKSSTFPPYDPWFAGGYINYYYFGFVIAAVPVKWLGIVPAIGYNLILPTFFSALALGGFSFAWNIFAARRNLVDVDEPYPLASFLRRHRTALLAGLAAAVALVLLGNLGTVRMIWHGMLRLVAPGGNLDGSTVFQRIGWTFQGLASLLSGGRLPYGDGDWYWIPSRVYPKSEITEFPFFTFLYADPHAHLFALPLTLLALGWALSIVLGRWRWGDDTGRLAGLHFAASFVLGGLVIGSLRPTNTWDLPTYLVIGIAAVLYTALRDADLLFGRDFGLSERARRWINALGGVVLLAGLAFLLFQPYARWYLQGYNSVRLWEGDRSPFWSYLTHWGLFLFAIVTWMGHETIDWMASTPVSALNRLKPARGLIFLLVAVLLSLVIALSLMNVQIAWLTLPLAAWAAVLLLRPGLPDAKRFVLFMVGSGLVLTLAVEVIVLVGDIDRMNTVFKFYLQAWTLLSLSAAASLVWLWPALPRWSSGWRNGWQTALALLVFGALLFPLMGGTAKIRDRIAPAAPHGLDGMAYMPYATYADFGVDMSLIQDYMAIRWLQDNVKGSPVIVEANVPEYRWGTRMTIYTGLPGVVGWNWHQRQQRGVVSDQWIFNRVDEVTAFYNTSDHQAAQDFLKKYSVQYIVVGQMEQAEYPGPGMDKFTLWDGDLWKQVFQMDNTTIYQVLP